MHTPRPHVFKSLLMRTYLQPYVEQLRVSKTIILAVTEFMVLSEYVKAQQLQEIARTGFHHAMTELCSYSCLET